MVLINDELDLPQTSEEFRGYINGYLVFLRAFLGVRSRLYITYEALANETDCITSTIVNMCLDERERRGMCLLILTWVWRETDHYLTKIVNFQPPAASPTLVASAVVLVPAYSDIVTHLRSGRILFLTTLPPALISVRGPTGITGEQVGGMAMWPPRPGPPAPPSPAPPPIAPPGSGGATPPPPAGRPRQQAVDLSSQNPRLKAAWAAAGHQNLYGDGSPFRDATQPSNRRVVKSLDNPAMSICLPVALRGSCFSGCTRSHDPLSPRDEEHVAQVGGLAL